EAEAVDIATTMLPQGVSARLAPYLRFMPRLTRAQQAAAANLGQFPPASEMGRDRTSIAAYVPSAPSVQASAQAPVQAPALASATPPAAGAVDARLTPSGEALGPAAAQDATATATAGRQLSFLEIVAAQKA